MKELSDSVRSYRIERYRHGRPETITDATTIEEPLEIRIGSRTLTVTMRTPGHDFELVAGFLLAEGLVRRPEEILRIEHCRQVRSPEEEENVVVVRTTVSGSALDRATRLAWTTSSCGLCGKGSIEAVHRRFPPLPANGPIALEALEGLSDRLRDAQTVFGQTGGLHAAGVFSLAGEPRVIREDVGRHNAVDKAIGRLFLDGKVPLTDSLLVVSGRASFEIVQKTLAAGIPLLAAVSAPSSLAVDLARESNLSLIGFLRDGGFNLYSGIGRLFRGENGRLLSGAGDRAPRPRRSEGPRPARKRSRSRDRRGGS